MKKPTEVHFNPTDMNPLLPLMCAVHHPDDGRFIILENGRIGFMPKPTGTAEITVEEFNAILGVTPEQVASMLACSKCGWTRLQIVSTKQAGEYLDKHPEVTQQIREAVHRGLHQPPHLHAKN